MRHRTTAALALSLAALGVAPTQSHLADAVTVSMRGLPALRGWTGPAVSTLTSRPVRIETPGARSIGAPTLATCLANGVNCYDPQQLRRAYGIDGLLARGDDGRGQTIVIIDAFGSPTLGIDLGTFDLAYGIPNPPSLEQYTPEGTMPFTPGNQAEISWGIETTLDVEWAHAMAPGANIDLLTSPVNETEGTTGLGGFLDLARYAVDHHLGSVLSQSWGVTEETLDGRQGGAMVAAFERVYARAERRRITVLAAAGDQGSANPSNAAETRVYAYPTVDFPASSPYVTSIGGTHLSASAGAGIWQSERVWNDGDGAGGGGVSRLFAEPAYQERLRRSKQVLLHGHRGVPDVSWDADPATGIAIYQSFDGTPGWDLIGGTSAATPQWAGLVADVDQARGNAIGFLNPELYRLGGLGGYYHDILRGSNGRDGVRGYSALAGWDAASGWGTPRSSLLRALRRAPART